ncbi:Aste57867_24424 [Aphanomyces stellatus]|uniref:Aste57867_24424 protein n=1 Tax=Aphanomyces stellatus TaxID=120398 RepID=A0A485LQB3_9STRA|nr:hypothetical protein As57867_024348 [Aphanomyces stellatus]VFU01064.1 Aste57867_24424 [Aphanomyces stellatus]
MEKIKSPKDESGKGKAAAKEDAGKTKLHVSRDDFQHTLHAHFQTSKGTGKVSDYDKGKDKYIRKHVVSFLRVKKAKVQSSTKRKLSSFDASKCKLLCITTHDVPDADPKNPTPHVVAQLHHVNFQSNFTIECRKTWALDTLESIENCLEDTAHSPRGSFRLHFDDREHDPLQWIVDDDEQATAMLEFVWTILALSVDTYHALPKSTFSIEELSDLAKLSNWDHKYGVDVDLVGFQKQKNMPFSTSVPTKLMRQRSASDESSVNAAPVAPWKSVEYADAMSLFATIEWGECTVDSVQLQWQQRLKLLEEENIDFLLTLQTKEPEKKSPIDVITAAVDGVLQQVQRAEKWTEDAEATLATTAANMSQFETLNNHMEVHFKNSVALQEALDAMIGAIDISREHMGILVKPVAIFPQDNIPEDSSTPADASLPKVLEAITRLGAAVKSMLAFQARRDELTALGMTFAGKVATAFEAYMHSIVKSWNSNPGQPRRRSLSGGAEVVNATSSKYTRDREMSDVNSVRRPSATTVEDVDWAFRSDILHSQLKKYQDVCQNVGALNPKTMVLFRDSYAKHVAPVYGTHLQAAFRALKEKVPKSKAGKPQWNITMSLAHSSTETTITTSASTLLHQALDHIVPLCLTEQAFVRSMFFDTTKKLKPEPVELTLLMEKLFDKLLKRLVEFGDAGVGANVFEAISMIVTAQQQLRHMDGQSEFVLNTLLNFQLHLKRSLSKYMEEQETWLANAHPDTRLVGVLNPVQKVMNLVTRLDEAAAGISTDDTENPLIALYERIILGLFSWLEKAAATKPKYAHLVRLENYHFLHGKLQALSEHSVPLKKYTDDAYDEYSKNLKAYVMWLWDCEVGKMTSLFATVETLLETVPIAEVQFHLSKQDLRKAIEASNQTLDKSMKHISERLKKHLSHSVDMTAVVVQSLRDVVLTNHDRYVFLSKQCYNVELEPTKEKLVALLDKLR